MGWELIGGRSGEDEHGMERKKRRGDNEDDDGEMIKKRDKRTHEGKSGKDEVISLI
jgi:hypothetical protein